MHSLLVVPHSTLTLEAFAAVWAEMRLRMLCPLMFDKVLKTDKFLIALVTLMPLVSFHVSLESRLLNNLVALWTLQQVAIIAGTASCSFLRFFCGSFVCLLMKLELRSLPESQSTCRAM